MSQQAATPGIRAGRMLGLTILVATVVFFTVLLVLRLGTLFDGGQAAAVAVSSLCAASAAFGMLVDAADLWVRGGDLTPRGVRVLRSLVFVAVVATLVTSLLGDESLVVPLLAPALIVYLFVARRRPAGATARVVRGAAGAGPGRPVAAPPRSRQRRGGRKRR